MSELQEALENIIVRSPQLDKNIKGLKFEPYSGYSLNGVYFEKMTINDKLQIPYEAKKRLALYVQKRTNFMKTDIDLFIIQENKTYGVYTKFCREARCYIATLYQFDGCLVIKTNKIKLKTLEKKLGIEISYYKRKSKVLSI